MDMEDGPSSPVVSNQFIFKGILALFVQLIKLTLTEPQFTELEKLETNFSFISHILKSFKLFMLVIFIVALESFFLTLLNVLTI